MTHPYIEHLITDHQKQREIGKKMRSATDPQERAQLRRQFREALLPHMAGEEASIFRYMEEAGGKTADQAMEAEQEHHVERVLLGELMELDPDDELYKPKASVLDETNLHHMNEEEKRQFLTLRDMASDKKLDELFDQYESAEEAFLSDMK